MPRHKTLNTLQAGRGIAALLVLLHHSGVTLSLDKYFGFDLWQGLFTFGPAGVEFFFVLSGFIIFFIHRPDIGHPERLKYYLRKRVARIYPIYWLIMLPLLGLFFFFPGFEKGGDLAWRGILSSAMLFHLNTGGDIVPCAWTLYHEVLFYAVFAVLILNRRIGILVCAAWGLASVFYLLTSETVLTPFSRGGARGLDFYFSPLHFLFLMGAAAGWLLQTGKIRYPGLLAGGGVALFFLLGMDENYIGLLSPTVRSLSYGIASMAAMAGFTMLEKQGRVSVHYIPKLLGDASYTIYLSHYPFLSVLSKIFCHPFIKPLFPEVVAYLIVILLALAGGVLLHLLVEKRVLSLIGKRRAPCVTAASSSVA